MCGIFLAILPDKQTDIAYSHFQKLRPRGPDFSSFQCIRPFLALPDICMSYGFHRLAINDISHRGNQPFYFDDGSFLVCNGEIYNFSNLKEQFLPDVVFGSHSDCEVILPLYKKLGMDFVKYLEGEFAFIIYDSEKQQIITARDHIGVRPMFTSLHTTALGLVISSELKGIPAGNAKHFPPGHIGVWSIEGFEISNFDSLYETSLQKTDLCFDDSTKALRIAVENAVISRLHSDVPVGCFLSGGIDSSAIAALAAKHYNGQISTFTLRIDGLPNEDAIYAREVAAHIGSNHHEIDTSLSEIFSLIDSIIFISETFNFEMLPNLILLYLVGRYVQANTNIKVLLDGTGPDEILGGYWFFRNAPTLSDFESETVKQLAEMHRTELLGERVVSHFGLEMRYPYLDQSVTDILLKLPREHKFTTIYGKEKLILRHAMKSYLPERVVWRKKLGMTHGAGENFENLFDREIRRRMGTSNSLESHDRILGIEKYYKDVFYKHFPEAQNVECNVTALPWRANDPIAIWR